MSDKENITESSSSESSSESDEDLIQDIPDKDFFKTLSYLKNKDPRIYDNNVEFFTQPPLIIKDKSKNDNTKTSQVGQNDSDPVQKSRASQTINNKPTSYKFSLKDFDNDSSSEDELVSLKKKSSDTPKVENEIENEYIRFLKGNKKELDDKEFEHELKPLKNYWNTESLDENEQFLKDYILNKKYLAADSELNENENLSEDERELEEQAEYEANYNFRFENENNLQLKRFPRNIEGSLRRKNDARSKKRAEIAQRKKEEKAKKYQDVKHKQKEKLSQIEERLQKLKELTGNVELGFKDEEILEDFDPEKHDQKMRELFNEDYYNKEDYEHPVFNEDEEDWQNYDVEMDDENVEGTKKLTRSQKKKLRKKKTYRDILEIAKPGFDPKVHNDFKKYIDEFYSLDCEDFIDDIPCKFKYREVVPNDYGLSVEEILMADDNELNRWASVKKCWKRQPEHVERNEVKVYRKKAQDETLKRTILKSLFTPPEEQEQSNTATHDTEKLAKNQLKRKLSDSLQENEGQESEKVIDHLSEEGNAVESVQENHTLPHNSKKKKKKKKHEQSVNSENIPENNNAANSEKSKRQPINDNEEHSTNLQDESVDDDKMDNSIERITESSNITESNLNGVSNELSNSTSNLQKKKKRRKKKKKSTSGETTTNENGQNNTSQEGAKIQKVITPVKSVKIGKKNNRQQLPRGGETGKFKNKFKNKFGFKKKNNSVVNLSDSRLQAYGIKPKQFRGKMIFSQKNKI